MRPGVIIVCLKYELLFVNDGFYPLRANKITFMKIIRQKLNIQQKKGTYSSTCLK
ncbi:hypothetical protein SAMN04487911_10388 [Arenibacter nanhaiticus]|uniref:Uncharacterized protein n=1 Tax=Arenibacter nanhaiticus TaxID=558155 RepID=A0A1M6C5M7_9FLAO|nr:hypothetical protein SAMN04487911_10388 [Arenibacter nanhaiticus]